MASSVSTASMRASKAKTSSRQFVVNVLSNIGVVGLNIVVGLWFTPYLIAHLGVALYGIVVLANSVTNYMSVVNAAIGNVTGRYLTIEIQQGQIEAANRTFNTAFWAGLLLMTGLLPIVMLMAHSAPYLFHVPTGSEVAVKWLFLATLVSYLLVILKGVFTASTFAHNRLDLQNTVASVNIGGRVLIVILLFGIAVQPELWHVGAGIITGGLFSLGLAFIVWRWLTPELKISTRLFDRSKLRSLSGMSGWTVINQMGIVLFLNVDLIVVNLVLGAEAGGRYGSALQWTILLRTLGATVATALTPVVLRQYALGDLVRMTELAQQAVKLFGLAFALPVGLITAFAAPLLSLWLGPEFAEMAPVLRVLVVHLCVNLAVLPLFSLQVAMNKVRWPGIVTLGMSILNVILAVWWAQWGEFGIGVAFAGAVVLTLKNTFYIPIYGAYIQSVPWDTYLLKMVPGVVATLGIGFIAYCLTYFVSFDSWFILFEYTALLAVIFVGYLEVGGVW